MKANTPHPGNQGTAQKSETSSWDPYAVWAAKVKDGHKTGSLPAAEAEWDPYEVWRRQIRKR